MASKIKYELSIIIPCFNEEKRLPKRFAKFKNYLLKNRSWELIFVNDGSVDNTQKVLEEIQKNSPKNIQIIKYRKNGGKGYAVIQGVKKANGEIIAFMDADFAYKLNAIPRFCQTIKDGADIVIADRSKAKLLNRREPSLIRRVLGRVLSVINNFILDFGDIYDSQCGFKFFKKSIAKEIFPKISIKGWLWDIDLLKLAIQRKYKIEKIPVNWEEVGNSKVSIIKDLIPVVTDLLRIYGKFFSFKMFIILVSLITFLILLPFLINPQSLTKRNGDFSDFVWPNYYLLHETFQKYHQIPFWNPTLLGGVPEIVSPGSHLIYPPNYLALILPADYAILILILGHILFGSTFLYLIGKKILKWDNLAVLTLSLGYIYSPFLWSKFAVGHLILGFSYCLLPAVIFFGMLLYQTRNIKYVVALAFLLGLMFLNHPTVWYFTLFFGLMFAFLISFFDKNMKALLRIIIGVFLTFLLYLPIFLLQYKTLNFFSRVDLGFQDLVTPIWSIKRFISSFVLPSNFLNDLETEVWLYTGMTTILTGIAGVLRIEKKYKISLLLVILFVVLITLGNRVPIFELLYNYVPGFKYLRVTTRDWFVFVIISAFLSAFFVNSLKGKLKFFIFFLITVDVVFFSFIRLWFIPEIMKPKINADINLIKFQNSQYRVYCTSRCLSARETIPNNILTADGYHVLIPKFYGEKLREAGRLKGGYYSGNLPTTKDYLSQPDAREMGNISIKWLVSEYELNDPNLKRVDKQGKYYIYENKLVKPRFRFKEPGTTLNILVDSPNKIVIDTEGNQNYLIIADNYFPGWMVYVNRVQVKLYLEDKWSRGIIIPKGKHRVEMKFSPVDILMK